MTQDLNSDYSDRGLRSQAFFWQSRAAFFYFFYRVKIFVCVVLWIDHWLTLFRDKSVQ